MATKKKSFSTKNSLPGAQLLENFKTAKSQTKGLLEKSKKKLNTAKVGEQNHAKKYKLAQDKLKKHETTHKTKPSKSSSKNVSSAKSQLKKVQSLHAQAQKSHMQAKIYHAEHQNHYDKLNHLHNAVQDAHKKWNNTNKR